MAAQYEKRVLTMDAWGQKQGYPPFCEVVTQEDGLANLQLIVDKVRGKEVPRVPAVSAFIEFCVGMMTGEVEKGGCRELRADPQLYATAGHGLSQAEMMMPLEKKGTFGWGPYKDAPYKLQSIQQYATALRVWLKEELRRWPDAGVANPMYDGWVASVMNYVQKELPFARMEERLVPPALTTGVFNEVINHSTRRHRTRCRRHCGSRRAPSMAIGRTTGTLAIGKTCAGWLRPSRTRSRSPA